jgi:hypothetical protein
VWLEAGIPAADGGAVLAGVKAGPCGWPAASLDSGCGGAVWPGWGCRVGCGAAGRRAGWQAAGLEMWPYWLALEQA